MLPASASVDSLSSSSSSHTNTNTTRLNRLLHRFASKDNLQNVEVSTPVRYNPATSRTASSEMMDETPLRPPVFESRFMRELELANTTANHPATAPLSATSQRPPLTISHSSPAAVVSPAGRQSHSRSPSLNSPRPASATGSGSGSASGSPSSVAANATSGLKRLVRVASSSSLFGHSKHTSPEGKDGSNTSPYHSPSHVSHRKTTSLLGGSTPSPRSRLTVSVTGHRHRHSEDVRSLSAQGTYTDNEPVQPLSPRLRALGAKDSNAQVSSSAFSRSKESLLSFGSLGRKKSFDGLSSATDSIAEEPASHPQDEHVSQSRPTSEDAPARPALGPRVLSSERPSTDLTSSTAHTLIGNGKSTPGFPRGGFSSASGGGAGIASGLSESSKRFRSAFRLNKTRAGTEAPSTGGIARRAMRVPIAQNGTQEDEEEQKEDNDGNASERSESPTMREEGRTDRDGIAPEDAQGSMRSMSSISSVSPQEGGSQKSSTEQAQERAQLVHHLPLIPGGERSRPADLSRSKRGALPAFTPSPEAQDKDKHQQNEQRDESPRSHGAYARGHARTASKARLEDMLLVPSSAQEPTRPAGDSDTLLARPNGLTRVTRPEKRQDENENEQEVIIDDKENGPSGAQMLVRPDSRQGKPSPPSRRTEHERPALAEVRRPLQHSASMGQLLPQPPFQPLGAQRLAKVSSASSNGGAGYHPSDRQVVVNDYAVPTKRSGDTPPDHHAKPFPHGLPYPSQQPQPQLRMPPPTSSLPAVPIPVQQQHLPAAEAPVVKRTVGTVTVKGKTYTRMGLLGRGGSSKVFRVCDKEHQVYALKKVDLGKGADSETYQAFLNEIELLERLRGHDRIIQLYASEVNEVKRSLIMVMEIGEIDLNTLLQERSGKRASTNFVRHTWEQMLEAVNVIHDEGIVHTDLKPANFVLVKGALKLIDFGIAKAIPNDTTNIARDQQIGTANYMSPEALSPHISNGARGERVMKLGRPSDVWSLGCILYQIVYGHTPFGRIKNLAAKMNAIQTPGFQIDFPTHAVPTTVKGEPLTDLAVRVEDDLLKCMKNCLRYEPKRRATIPQLLEDPFLRREEGSSSNKNEEEAAPFDPGLVANIVQRTIQWSAGRQPSRSEQERFIEAMVRQVQQAQMHSHR